MIHTLGFSSSLFQYFKTGKQITVGKGYYLTGPYINEEVKRQYSCSNGNGMLLETGMGSGTSLSHWSKKAAFNELMTANVAMINPTISYITFALL